MSLDTEQKPKQNRKHKSKKILITGVTGSGKTTYFERFVFNSNYTRKLVFDHIGNIEWPFEPATSESEIDDQYENGFVVFDPSEMFPGNVEEAFEFFSYYSFEKAKLDPFETKLFAVDEIQLLIDTWNISDEARAIIQTGRGYSLDFIAIAQQLNEVHNKMRAQMSEIVTFFHDEPRVLEALEQRGFNPVEVQSLKCPGEFIARNVLTRQQVRQFLRLT